MSATTILAISDTHDEPFANRCIIECFSQGVQPDLFIHVGDGTNYGSPGEIERLADQLAIVSEFGCPVIYVPGNHDLLFERQPHLARSIVLDTAPKVILPKPLETVEAAGLRIYCNPYVPPVGNWAFCMPVGRFAQALKATFPYDTGVDIIASHSPVYESQDLSYSRQHLGYQPLKSIAKHSKLILCGHIHEAQGRGSTYVSRYSRYIPTINCAGVPMLHTIN